MKKDSHNLPHSLELDWVKESVLLLHLRLELVKDSVKVMLMGKEKDWEKALVLL